MLASLFWGIVSVLVFLLKFTVVTTLLFVASVLFVLYYYQSLLLYMPAGPELPQIPYVSSFFKQQPPLPRASEHNPPHFRSPAEHSAVESWEDHYITTKDNVKLHCWLLLQKVSKNANVSNTSTTSPTIIFFHGNAGNIGVRLYNAVALYQSCRANVLMVDYRGYGQSEGVPSEFGLQQDVDAVLHYAMHLLPVIDPSQLYVFGRSLGGAAAIYACTQKQQLQRNSSHNNNSSNNNSSKNSSINCDVKGVIVENTFTSIEDIVLVLARKALQQQLLPTSRFFTQVLPPCLMLLLTSRWPSAVAIADVTAPMLFISGLADQLVPPAHMQQLHTAAAAARFKQMYTVPGGDHNATFVKGGHKYFETIDTFIKKCKKTEKK